MTQFSPIRPYLLRIPLTPNSANRCNFAMWGKFQIEVMPSDLSICLYLYLLISVCTYQFVSVHMCICAHVFVYVYEVLAMMWSLLCSLYEVMGVISWFSFECHCHPSWWWVSPRITYHWMPFLICISRHRPLPASTISSWAYSLLPSDDLLMSWSFCFPVEYAGCICSLLTMAFDWP